MQQANDFHRVGELLQVRKNHSLALYGERDPERRFYEFDYLAFPEKMIVLDVVVVQDKSFQRKIHSYKVLTTRGTFHIQAWTREHQYSYLQSV